MAGSFTLQYKYAVGTSCGESPYTITSDDWADLTDTNNRIYLFGNPAVSVAIKLPDNAPSDITYFYQLHQIGHNNAMIPIPYPPQSDNQSGTCSNNWDYMEQEQLNAKFLPAGAYRVSIFSQLTVNPPDSLSFTEVYFIVFYVINPLNIKLSKIQPLDCPQTTEAPGAISVRGCLGDVQPDPQPSQCDNCGCNCDYPLNCEISSLCAATINVSDPVDLLNHVRGSMIS
jgi:hypothetical protein